MCCLVMNKRKHNGDGWWRFGWKFWEMISLLPLMHVVLFLRRMPKVNANDTIIETAVWSLWCSSFLQSKFWLGMIIVFQYLKDIRCAKLGKIIQGAYDDVADKIIFAWIKIEEILVTFLWSLGDNCYSSKQFIYGILVLLCDAVEWRRCRLGDKFKNSSLIFGLCWTKCVLIWAVFVVLAVLL